MLRSQVKIIPSAFGALAIQALITIFVKIRAEVTLSLFCVLLRYAFCAVILGGAFNAVRIVGAAKRADIGIVNKIFAYTGFASLEVAFDAIEIEYTAT